MQEPSEPNVKQLDRNTDAIDDSDYYLEGTVMVFTARFHLRRGYCCGNGCRHCPYTDVAESST